MKRWMLVAAGATVIALIIVFSVAGSGGDAETVYVTPVKVQRLEAVVSAPGEIDPKLKVNISAHVIGKIEKLYFKEGDVVRRGDKLVDLEKPSYVAQRDRMQSELAARHIEVERARVALRTAELNFGRAAKLREQGIQAQELYDRAEVDLQNAKAAYASALETVRETQAGLTQANEDLRRTTIVAPIDGKIVQLNAHEGEVVVTGTMNNAASVIAVLADLSEILVETEVAETEVVQVHVGQNARVFVDAIPDKQYRGRVVEVGSSATVRQTAGSGVRVFIVKVAIADADDRLRPGMTSRVEIVTSETTGSAVVPIQSVVERTKEGIRQGGRDDDDDEAAAKRKYVFVVRGGTAHAAEVRTGISDNAHVAILSGVRNGEQVVSGPMKALRKLRDGDAVQIEQEERTAGDGGNDDESKQR